MTDIHPGPEVAGYTQCRFCGKYVPTADDPQLAPTLTAAMMIDILDRALHAPTVAIGSSPPVVKS